MAGIGSMLKRNFLSGVLVVVPLILTYLVLRFLLETLDGILRPPLAKLIGRDIPLVGFVALIVLIFVAGVLVRSYVGHRLYGLGERWLVRLPLIRPIYSAAKQLLEALAGPKMNAFKEVALIEYPRLGLWSMVFIAGRTETLFNGAVRKCAVAFIASTPTPISGMVVIIPEEQVWPLDMTIEEGVKFIVSGGVVTPALLKERSAKDADTGSKGLP